MGNLCWKQAWKGPQISHYHAVPPKPSTALTLHLGVKFLLTAGTMFDTMFNGLKLTFQLSWQVYYDPADDLLGLAPVCISTKPAWLTNKPCARMPPPALRKCILGIRLSHQKSKRLKTSTNLVRFYISVNCWSTHWIGPPPVLPSMVDLS